MREWMTTKSPLIRRLGKGYCASWNGFYLYDEDLQRVLQRMWINALGEDAEAIASSGPDAEGLVRLRQLRERIASLKALLPGQAGQAA